MRALGQPLTDGADGLGCPRKEPAREQESGIQAGNMGCGYEKATDTCTSPVLTAERVDTSRSIDS